MKQYRMLIFGVLIALVAWPVDALVDSSFFEGDGFLIELLHPSALEIYFRSIVMLCVLGMATIAHTSLRKLQDSEDRFSLAMRGSNDGIWDWDLQRNTFYCSPRWKEMLGYGAEEIGNSFENWIALAHPDDKAGLLKKLRAYTGGNQDSFESEIRLRHKNGDWISVLSRGFLVRRESDNKAIRMVGTHTDITERKRLEEANRVQLHHLRAMDRISSVISQAMNPDDMLRAAIDETRRIFASDRAWLLYPCDPDAEFWDVPIEAASEQFPGAFTSEDRLRMSQPMKQLLNSALQSDTPIDDHPEPDTDDTATQFSVRSRLALAIRPRFGKPWLFGLHQCANNRQWTQQEIALLRDIGDRLSDLLTATQLYRDTLKLSEAIKQAGEAIMITDREGLVEYVNPAFTAISGYSLDEIHGQKPSILKSPKQDPDAYAQLWNRVLQGGTWQGSMLNRRKDGHDYPALMTVAPLRDENDAISHFVAIQRDMSDYHRMEEQFLQAQKLEAVGTLVGGIAHDFNNTLAAIQGNVYLGRLKLGNNPEAAARLDNIDQLSHHATRMVRQLLSFARKDKAERRTFSITSFVKEGIKLARPGIPASIDLRFDYDGTDMNITGDATRLQQALMNLLNNARDAVQDRPQPCIDVKLARFAPDTAFLARHPDARPREYALLSVRDNGCGIREENLDKVFEPFFTTKEADKGTGLGLAMVYGTVLAHEGLVEVESNENSGTTLRLYLPVQSAPDKEERSTMEAPGARGHGEVILLADDDENLRKTTGDVLHCLGYSMMYAADGEQAMQIFDTAGHAIDLLITDIVMPNMGGVQLAEAVRKQHPDLPVIFVTGYDRDQMLKSDNKPANSIRIAKPFSYSGLSHAIRKLLDARPED